MSSLPPPSVLPDISPSRGEIGSFGEPASSFNVENWRKPRSQPISPLEGEMAGRTEGGVKDRSGEGCLFSRTALICIFASFPTPAFAHASDRGHVLLLPTGYYVAGGAFAVAASFLALALLPPDSLDRIWRRRLPLFAFGDGARTIVSLLSFAGFAILVAAGLFGSRDPLSNPLPLVIWTLLWVGLTLLQGVFGDLWSWLNPWYGPWRVVTRLIGRRGHETQGSRWPRWLGYWPAVVLFFAFAWFELIDPAPDDPARLAWAVGLYWLLSFVAMLCVRLSRLEPARRIPVGLLRHGGALRRRRARMKAAGSVSAGRAPSCSTRRRCRPAASLSCCWRCRRSPSTACRKPSSGSACSASIRSNFRAAPR